MLTQYRPPSEAEKKPETKDQPADQKSAQGDESSTTNTAPPPPQNPSHKSRNIGIGLASAGVGLVAGVGLFFFMRKRRNQKLAKAQGSSMAKLSEPPPVYYSPKLPQGGAVQELVGSQMIPQELEGPEVGGGGR